MGILDEIKKNAENSGAKIQTTENADFEKVLNKTFFLDKDIDEETKFVNMVMTRGLGTQTRAGLHASAIIVGDKQWCTREQVLSLLFERIQKENTSVGLLRIFEEGNAIHEKWQRLFIRAGYAKAKTLDRTRFDEEYEVSFTPDIVCRIPEVSNGAMIGEIKSVNTFQFKKMTEHPSGKKQLQFYMYLCQKAAKKKGKWNGVDYTKGFTLCDDKNTQDFKVNLYEFSEKAVEPYIDRLERVKYYKELFLKEGKLVARCKDCKNSNSKRALECPMRNACFDVGFGRKWLNEKE